MIMRSRPATRSRIRRLERHERVHGSHLPERPYTGTEFHIEPASARAIVEDYNHLYTLMGRKSFAELSGNGMPLPGEAEEAAARLAERLPGIRCPADYWAKQVEIDRNWQSDLGWGNRTLSKSEVHQLEARLIVFAASPAGAASRRMFQLTHRRRNVAENAEFDELNRQYPGMPLEVKSDALMASIRFQEESRGVVEEDWETELWRLVPR
jgi:hypothetical protein